MSFAVFWRILTCGCTIWAFYLLKEGTPVTKGTTDSWLKINHWCMLLPAVIISLLTFLLKNASLFSFFWENKHVKCDMWAVILWCIAFLLIFPLTVLATWLLVVLFSTYIVRGASALCLLVEIWLHGIGIEFHWFKHSISVKADWIDGQIVETDKQTFRYGRSWGQGGNDGKSNGSYGHGLMHYQKRTFFHLSRLVSCHLKLIVGWGCWPRGLPHPHFQRLCTEVK